MPEGDTLYRTAQGLRPYLVGRDVLAARAQGPGPVPQIQRVVGKRVDAIEAHGKNLLILSNRKSAFGSAGKTWDLWLTRVSDGEVLDNFDLKADEITTPTWTYR